MKVIKEYAEAIQFKPYCIALGSFDGVHVGHQQLIKQVIQKSKEYNTNSMVYTFFKNPKKILFPNKPIYLITDNDKRAQIIDSMNIDVLFLEDFCKIMNISAESFVKDILIDMLNVKCAVVGYNFHFGVNGEGNVDLLSYFGKKYKFEVVVIQPVKVSDHVVSSSLIRHLIRNGKVEEVKDYLGRNYSINGLVVHGKQNGKVIGIRTANLQIETDITIPHRGVYFTDTIVDGITYKSVTNIGYNPTFSGEKLSLETHIIGFCGELYGKKIEVIFLKWIREEKLFENTKDLINQIKSDINTRINY